LKPLQGVELCLLATIQGPRSSRPEYICDESSGKYREPTEIQDGKTRRGSFGARRKPLIAPERPFNACRSVAVMGGKRADIRTFRAVAERAAP
jgi:hypothetical protein